MALGLNVSVRSTYKWFAPGGNAGAGITTGPVTHEVYQTTDEGPGGAEQEAAYQALLAWIGPPDWRGPFPYPDGGWSYYVRREVYKTVG